MKTFRNIVIKLLCLFLALFVIFLNFPVISICSTLSSDDCCCIVKSARSCCKPNIEARERLSRHCGCQMKSTSGPADLYIDLKLNSSFSFKKFSPQVECVNPLLYSFKENAIISYHSPPFERVADIYLFNLNLRI